MHVRTLDTDDVTAAVRLSTGANWNQIATDWRRLLELAPDACYGGWVDGELVATATVVTHGGSVGWIGMILVDETHRRQGYGSTMFEEALGEVLTDGVRVGLDATADGRSVYRQYGFRDIAPVVRWGGSVEARVPTDDVATFDDPKRVAALDRRACGTDRGDLLSRLIAEERTVGLVRGSAPDGYGILRPGRERAQLGPVVASDRETAAALVSAAARRTNGLVVDSFADGAIEEVFSEHGLRPERDLTRMVHDDPTDATRRASDVRPEARTDHDDPAEVLMGDAVVAAAGLELG